MSLPIFKLGALLAKQLAKPLSKILKAKATTNPNLKKYIIIPTANMYHNFDVTVRMKIMGLGSPDKVPPLTEKQAVELGGDILAEFFVFGTAIAIVLIEYIRSGIKQASKESTLDGRVASLEANAKALIEKNEASNQRITEMSTVIVTQKAKIEELNNKVNMLDARRNIKYATQASQTTEGRQIGKVIQSKSMNNGNNASSDVTNSILYQIADEASKLIFPFKKNEKVLPDATPEKVVETSKPTTPTTSKAIDAKKQLKPTTTAKNTETTVKNLKPTPGKMPESPKSSTSK